MTAGASNIVFSSIKNINNKDVHYFALLEIGNRSKEFLSLEDCNKTEPALANIYVLLMCIAAKKDDHSLFGANKVNSLSDIKDEDNPLALVRLLSFDQLAEKLEQQVVAFLKDHPTILRQSLLDKDGTDSATPSNMTKFIMNNYKIIINEICGKFLGSAVLDAKIKKLFPQYFMQEVKAAEIFSVKLYDVLKDNIFAYLEVDDLARLQVVDKLFKSHASVYFKNNYLQNEQVKEICRLHPDIEKKDVEIIAKYGISAKEMWALKIPENIGIYPMSRICKIIENIENGHEFYQLAKFDPKVYMYPDYHSRRINIYITRGHIADALLNTLKPFRQNNKHLADDEKDIREINCEDYFINYLKKHYNEPCFLNLRRSGLMLPKFYDELQSDMNKIKGAKDCSLINWYAYIKLIERKYFDPEFKPGLGKMQRADSARCYAIRQIIRIESYVKSCKHISAYGVRTFFLSEAVYALIIYGYNVEFVGSDDYAKYQLKTANQTSYLLRISKFEMGSLNCVCMPMRFGDQLSFIEMTEHDTCILLIILAFEHNKLEVDAHVLQELFKLFKTANDLNIQMYRIIKDIIYNQQYLFTGDNLVLEHKKRLKCILNNASAINNLIVKNSETLTDSLSVKAYVRKRYELDEELYAIILQYAGVNIRYVLLELIMGAIDKVILQGVLKHIRSHKVAYTVLDDGDGKVFMKHCILTNVTPYHAAQMLYEVVNKRNKLPDAIYKKVYSYNIKEELEKTFTMGVKSWLEKEEHNEFLELLRENVLYGSVVWLQLYRYLIVECKYSVKEIRVLPVMPDKHEKDFNDLFNAGFWQDRCIFIDCTAFYILRGIPIISLKRLLALNFYIQALVYDLIVVQKIGEIDKILNELEENSSACYKFNSVAKFKSAIANANKYPHISIMQLITGSVPAYEDTQDID